MTNPAAMTWTGQFGKMAGPLAPGHTDVWEFTGDWAAEDVFLLISADYVGTDYSGEFEVTMSRYRDASQNPPVDEPRAYITCKSTTDPAGAYYW